MLKIWNNKTYLVISLIMLWQLISVGLLSTGVWPQEVVWFNFGLLAAAAVFLPRVQALGLFLLSLPFMVVLPEGLVNYLPSWRPLVVWLFAVVVLKYLWQRWEKGNDLIGYFKRTATEIYKEKLNPWDKWLAALVALAAISLLVADFPVHGLKQLIYLINVYLLYLSTLLAIEDNEEWVEVKRYLRHSLLITVALGFLQFFAAFFTEPYDFWQYWATLVSGAYYGVPLADVLAYSNSWFSAQGGSSSLRMFGILQDTHAFAVVAIFGLALWWARAKVLPVAEKARHVFHDQSKWYWAVLVALCFAIIASGTRGAWVALAVPIAATLIFIYKFKARLLGALPMLSYGLIIILFLVSPWLTTAFSWLRSVAMEDNILQRAASIYDLREDSNVGRLEIWQESLRYSLHNPLGTGYGNFITSIVEVPPGATFEEVSSSKNLRYNLPQKFVTAHSLYLNILVEIGLVGLILFGLFWLSVARQIWQALTESQFAYSYLNMFFTAVAIALLWLLAYGLFDVTIFNERVLLYLMTLLGLLNIALRNKPQTLF